MKWLWELGSFNDEVEGRKEEDEVVVEEEEEASGILEFGFPTKPGAQTRRQQARHHNTRQYQNKKIPGSLELLHSSPYSGLD